MTQDDLKKLDKKMRQIQDPFGTGFQMLIRLLRDRAKDDGITVCEVGRQYTAWKMKR